MSENRIFRADMLASNDIYWSSFINFCGTNVSARGGLVSSFTYYNLDTHYRHLVEWVRMKGGVLLLKLQYTHNQTTFSSTTIIAGSRIYTLSIMYYQVDPAAQNHYE